MKVNLRKLEIAMANTCISISSLCKETDLNYSTLSRIKSGADAHPATVGKIAKALGVNVEELIEDTAATVNQLNQGSEGN